jgi:cytidine deaminase
MTNQSLQINYQNYPSVLDLPQIEQDLILAAQKATFGAYAPYSNFNVGAAMLLANGQIVTGSNQENAAFPSGSCAERSAIFWIGGNFPNIPILTIAVTSRPSNSNTFKGVSPCGACRQAMLEYETKQKSPIRFLMLDAQDQVVALHAIADLLPFKFDSFKTH